MSIFHVCCRNQTPWAGWLEQWTFIFSWFRRLHTHGQGAASSVSSEVPFPDLQMATSVSYSPSSAHGWGLGGGRSCVSSSSSKDSRPVGLGPTLMMSLNLNYPGKDLSPNIVTLAIRASTSELGVGLGTEVSPGGCDGAVICTVLTGRNSVPTPPSQI